MTLRIEPLLGQNFGIHTVNTSARPSGSMSNADVEALVSSKLQAAFRQFHGLCCRFLHHNSGQIHFTLQNKQYPSPPPQLTKRNSPSSLSNSCRGRRPLWVAPSRTLCSACLPQFSLRIKSPNSRSTSSRFLRFRKGVPTSRT